MKKLKQSLLVLSSLYFTAAHAQSVTPAPATVEKLSDLEEKNTYYNPWRVSYFGLASTPTKALDYGSPAVGSYNYVGLNYKISKDTKISARVAFIQNFAGNNERGENKPQETYLSDAHLVYSDYAFATLGPVNLSMSFKFYLPTSESSQATHMIVKFRPEMYWEWDYSGYSSLTYVVKPDYYFQRQTAYISSTAKMNSDGSYVFDPRKTNKIASLEHYLEWDMNINKYFSFLPSAGFAEEWFYGSKAEGLSGGHETKSRIAGGVKVRPVKGFDFTLLWQNNANLIPARGQKSVRLFHPDDNQIVLMTNASLF